ncbi:MAG: dienelactone hydrolase family protein [Fibrobacteraceae bacterium]
MLECIFVETNVAPNASVIWMHGLGADGHDFEGIIPELNLPPHLGIRFIFPNAPVRPVTIANCSMRAWYDIFHPYLGNEPDIAGILQMAKEIELLVDAEIARGIASHRIVLAGFSQGGVLALEVGPRYPKRLAGVMALSTYSPTASLLAKEATVANAELPIFWGHGSTDMVVPEPLMRNAEMAFVQAKYPVEFHLYPGMAHSVCPAEISDLSQFLQRVFS